jgi:hypothetical protein
MNTAILDPRPAMARSTVSLNGAATNLVRLLALDRLPAGRRQLVGRWHRDKDGRLVCSWEPDMRFAPHRGMDYDR